MAALIKSSKDENDAEALILGEIESIGEAFDVLQKQNSQLIKQIVEKDEALTRVSGEVDSLVLYCSQYLILF